MRRLRHLDLRIRLARNHRRRWSVRWLVFCWIVRLRRRIVGIGAWFWIRICSWFFWIRARIWIARFFDRHSTGGFDIRIIDRNCCDRCRTCSDGCHLAICNRYNAVIAGRPGNSWICRIRWLNRRCQRCWFIAHSHVQIGFTQRQISNRMNLLYAFNRSFAGQRPIQTNGAAACDGAFVGQRDLISNDERFFHSRSSRCYFLAR